jgi:hypothetical protein
MAEFDLPPDLLAPPRAVSTIARSGFTGWLFDKLDGWLGVPTDRENAAAFWGVAALVSLGLTWGAWKLTLSMGRAWNNYTKGRITTATATGAVVVALPAAGATLITMYCFHRARLAGARKA